MLWRRQCREIELLLVKLFSINIGDTVNKSKMANSHSQNGKEHLLHHVCPSVCIEQPLERFHEILYWRRGRGLPKSIERAEFWLKSDKNSGHLFTIMSTLVTPLPLTVYACLHAGSKMLSE